MALVTDVVRVMTIGWSDEWLHGLDPHNGALCAIMLTFNDNNPGGYNH